VVAKILLFILAFGCSGPSLAAQEPPAAPQYSAEALEMWDRIGEMLIPMAEQFPADKYDFKPTPDVRSFKEQLLHVAGANYFFIRLAGGEKTKPSHAGRETKEDVITVLKESYADGAARIRELGEEGMQRQVRHPFGEHQVSLHRIWTMAAGHAGEHYGQLVVYYRLNGLVPPATLQQEQQ